MDFEKGKVIVGWLSFCFVFLLLGGFMSLGDLYVQEPYLYCVNSSGANVSFCEDDDLLVYNRSVDTGWADYIDTEYNNSNRFLVSGGSEVHFPNNAGEIRLGQMPDYINESGGFYNGTHLIGRNGDGYEFAFRGAASSSGVDPFCQFNISIGGGINPLPVRLLSFPKGNRE